MADLSSSLIVRLIDRVTGPAKAVSKSLRGIGTAARAAQGGGLAATSARLHGAIERNNKALGRARMGMLDAVAGVYALQRGLGAPIEAAASFEGALTDLATKVDLTKAQMRAIGNEARLTGRKVNQFGGDLVGGLDYLAGMGLDLDRARRAMPGIGRAATATRAPIIDLAKAAYAAIASLKIAPEEIGKSFDIMAQAGKDGGFELKDMATYFPSITAAAQAMGITGQKGLADLSAALQIVRRGAGDGAEAATNFQNILQKMNSPLTVKKFREFGIDLRKELKQGLAAGESPLETLLNLTNRALKGDLSKLGDIFQDAQVQKGLRPLLQNMRDYIALRDKAANAEGVIEKDFAKQMETFRERLKRLSIGFENIKIGVGNALLPALSAIVDRVSPLAARLAELAERFPKLSTAIIGTASALVALRVATAGLSFLGLAGKGSLLQLASGLVSTALGARKAVAFLGAPLVGAIRHVAGVAQVAAMRFRMMSVAMGAGQLGAAGAAKGTFATLGRAILGLLNPMGLVRAAFIGLRVALISTGIGAIVAGIAMAGTWIYNNWAGIKEMFAGFASGFMAAIKPIEPVLSPVAGLIGRIHDAISGLIGPLDASAGQWRSWGETIGGVVGGAVNSIIGAISRLIGLLSTAIEKAYSVGRAVKSWFTREGARRGSLVGSDTGGALPARAKGGHVSAGRTYLVGEEGPERFRPRQSGYIEPNGAGQGGGPVTVTIGPFTFHNTSAADAPEIAAQIRRVMREEVREAFRGVYADAGIRFA